ATDYPQFKAIGEVAADAMAKIGINVDYVATDWGTMLQRRSNKGPLDQGGWSCFNTGWEGADHMDPSNLLEFKQSSQHQLAPISVARQRPRQVFATQASCAAGC
ncbi:MAG TPA: hypothetical protein VJ735_22660, partial [Actinomycetes bacterium]|nr:hypothetical protein [Actinomycetes bacterium]